MVRRAKRRRVGGGDSDEALTRPLAAKIGVNHLSMKKSSILVTRYLDFYESLLTLVLLLVVLPSA
jgi:hypothetical protein